MIRIPITQIVSRNCGGHGAWIDNPLSSPSPGPDLWPGFQIGGGNGKRKRNKSKKIKKLIKSRKYNTYKKSKKSRKINMITKLKR